VTCEGCTIGELFAAPAPGRRWTVRWKSSRSQ